MARAAVNPCVFASAFLLEYYDLLNSYPEGVYHFYEDPSRPTTADGRLQEVKKRISLLKGKLYWLVDYCDPQWSHMNGLFIVAQGRAVGYEDFISRRFTQSFFLAPKEKDYFVLNDALCLIEVNEPPIPRDLFGYVSPVVRKDNPVVENKSEKEDTKLVQKQECVFGFVSPAIRKTNPVVENKSEKEGTKLAEKQEVERSVGTNTTFDTDSAFSSYFGTNSTVSSSFGANSTASFGTNSTGSENSTTLDTNTSCVFSFVSPAVRKDNPVVENKSKKEHTTLVQNQEVCTSVGTIPIYRRFR